MRVDHANHAATTHAVRRPTPAPAPDAAPPSAEVALAPQPTKGKASGVIDKLASGHFNDVAALRLRTNHAEAIAAAGLELPEAPTETTRAGQGFAKALAAYQAAMPAADPDPVAETLEDVLAEPGVDEPLALAVDPVVDTGTPAVPTPIEDTVLDALFGEPTEPVDVTL